jgi:hypothetical protein
MRMSAKILQFPSKREPRICGERRCNGVTVFVDRSLTDAEMDEMLREMVRCELPGALGRELAR